MLTTIVGGAMIGWTLKELGSGAFTGAMAAPRMPAATRTIAPARFWTYVAANVAFLVAGVAFVWIEQGR